MIESQTEAAAVGAELRAGEAPRPLIEYAAASPPSVRATCLATTDISVQLRTNLIQTGLAGGRFATRADCSFGGLNAAGNISPLRVVFVERW